MNLLEAAISFVESNQEKAARMTSNHQEKNRRSREERRHGGCAKGREQTPAQQERRSGRKGPQACKASSVRFPARRLAVERRDWLQRQDLNLRHRGYEPRGMTASLRCGKNGVPSFCGLRGYLEEIGRRKLNTFGSCVSEEHKRISLGNNAASAAACLRIHPAIDPRDVFAGHGRHSLNANFGNHRLRWL